MSLKCLFGHQWNACKCERCGKIRDEGHNFVHIDGKCIKKCTICGKERTIEHIWNGCKCSRCGKVRDEQHDWDLCKGKCKRCGATQAEQHDFGIYKGESKCKLCGIIKEPSCKKCGITETGFDEYYERQKQLSESMGKKLRIISKDHLVICKNCFVVICTVCLHKNDGICPQCKKEM